MQKRKNYLKDKLLVKNLQMKNTKKSPTILSKQKKSTLKYVLK